MFSVLQYLEIKLIKSLKVLIKLRALKCERSQTHGTSLNKKVLYVVHSQK